ncbi:MAG TPA: tetratricopeptide repeat protein [Puia sp.]|jgi:tetratricopeptide (TPR) repeat protein/DNA-binding CsgD family transcriptional regulator
MYYFFGLALLLSASVLCPAVLRAQGAQEGSSAELVYTERLSKQFPDSAFLLLKEMYSQSIAKKDRLGTGICLQQMGQICYYLGNFPQALDFHGQADKLFRAVSDRERIAANLNDMGILYYYNRQTPLAWTQYEEALGIYQSSGNIGGMADTYGRIGHLYEKRQRYDSAFYFQRMALQQYSRISHKQGMAKIYENMGSIYEDLERYDSSWYYFKLSLDLYEQAGEEVASIEVVNNLGDIYRKTGRYREAIVQTGKALALAEKTNDLYEKGAAYRDLGKAYDLLHQEDSAYHYLELSRRSTIDVYSKENNRQTAFLSVLFDIDKKNDEIVKLENDRNITFIITLSVIVVVILLIVLGWVTISRQRMKIRSERVVMQAELASRQLEEGKLVQELEVRRKGLTTYTLHVIQKNQLLESLRDRLSFLVKEDKRDQKKQLQQLIQQINQNFNHDQYWDEFRETFGQVHQQFFDHLKQRSEELTANDLRLLALIKLNLNSGDVATLLGISQDSLRVSRYRLKKKLNLSAEESLTAFVHAV